MRRLIVVFSCMWLFSQTAGSDSIVGSRHDLSTATQPRICEFCHTPHAANVQLPNMPLWNRSLTNQTFTLYSSPTQDVTPSQPRMISRLCLSCHDGISTSTDVAGRMVDTKHGQVNRVAGVTGSGNCERCHTDIMHTGRQRTLVLGIDLANDHPVSLPYPTPGQDPAFKTPPDASKGWVVVTNNEVKLFNGWIECSSCHNVHNPAITPFLRKSNAQSRLCITCHDR